MTYKRVIFFGINIDSTEYNNNMKNQVRNIVLSSLFILIVAVLGSVFVNLGTDWFNSLSRPSQWIPNALIPIVWTVIYIAFAIINYLWIRKGGIPKRIIILMIINGVFNVLWCLVFFTLNLLFIGNIVIILNLIIGYILIYNIFKSEKIYGHVLSIYPVWLSIATTLNLALWILN